MKTKDDLKRAYQDFKTKFGRIPKRDELLKHAGTNQNNLDILYGSNAYSLLQADCGDKINKLDLQRTPEDQIMRQWGDLARELQRIPTIADWRFKKLKPSPRALGRNPHNLS